ncbi:hypothetical protein EUTSA_v10024105mg [Eutrema salsugineum]|uniref:Transcription elongation factor TFIIS/CRSP70 N-terminal sub-type domain-containing protein n=1 Tax=Eutrema salsugineum TaxID=72664 RepID=V4KI61_EUTSA|nr:hypothetical protein EUTSA_v10024105mg [Eutrema salsugineum]
METPSLHRLGLNKTKDQRSRPHQTGHFKSFALKPIHSKKKQSALPIQSHLAHEVGEIKKNLNKPDVFCKSVPATSKKKHPPLKVTQNAPSLRKNATETLELFEIAKKSADVANAKGLLLAKEETSICINTLSFSSIMERLSYLTTHKDHKICNLASALLHHWRQSIRDQQLTKTP